MGARSAAQRVGLPPASWAYLVAAEALRPSRSAMAAVELSARA
jgi:hypothetical protein